LCLAPCAFAQLNLQINNPPSNNILDNIYVGAYSATNTLTGAATQIICDDFQDNSDYNPTTYTVNNFSNLGSTMWGSWLESAKGGGLSSTQVTTLFDEAAWLTLQMLGQTGTQQAYDSYAIWAVFSPGQVASWLKGKGDMAACNAVFGNACTSTNNLTSGLLYNAQQNYGKGDYSNFLILDPQGCTSPGTCKEQEFFQIVAEGGTAAIYLLLAGSACFGAMFFRSRRQNRRVGMA
jgi:hypothetical protein